MVCHTDPLLDKSPEVKAIENQFKEIIDQSSQITGYHDFRVISESPDTVIIVADIDVAEDVSENEFDKVSSELESQVKAAIPNVAYSSFYITPKYSY